MFEYHYKQKSSLAGLICCGIISYYSGKYCFEKMVLDGLNSEYLFIYLCFFMSSYFFIFFARNLSGSAALKFDTKNVEISGPFGSRKFAWSDTLDVEFGELVTKAYGFIPISREPIVDFKFPGFVMKRTKRCRLEHIELGPDGIPGLALALLACREIALRGGVSHDGDEDAVQHSGPWSKRPVSSAAMAGTAPMPSAGASMQSKATFGRRR